MSKPSKKSSISVLGWTFVIGLVCIAIYGMFVATNHYSTETFYNSNASTTEQTIEEEVIDESDLKKESIRSREDIKRQQELIVQETYLNEERQNIEKKKAEAIEEFNSQLEHLESQLEEVRGEKMSFQ